MTAEPSAVMGVQETPWLEFKREIRNRDSLGQVICALANDLCRHEVGYLLIGVDRDGVAVGADTSDAALLHITQIRNEGNILPLPSMIVEAVERDETSIIMVTVNASQNGPVRYKGVCYVRPGPQTKEATADDERVLTERMRSAAVVPELRPLPTVSLADINQDLVRTTVIPAAVSPEVIKENGRPVIDQMASLGLLTIDRVPTLLGVLVAAYDPSAFVSGAYVQFVRYDGLDETSAIVDDEEIRENLVTAVGSLTTLVQLNIRRSIVEVNELTERPSPDYPLAAVRETIINAVVHRTYDGSNAPVRILWFADRVEVSSPGGPYGVVTNENFDRTTDYRNPSLAAMMKNLGYLNRFGRGISRTSVSMRNNGNPEPIYDIGQSWWNVTLRRAR